MKVFVSYSSHNRPAVKALVADLESLSHEVWFDQELSGGQNWWDQILSQIRACDLFIFALSNNSIRSDPCKLEYTYAYELKKPIVPVMLSDDVAISLLPVILQERQFVNYINQDKAALLALNEALRNTPPAPELPSPLPEPPAAPISPLAKLKADIEQPDLSYERQVYLFHEIKTHAENPELRQDALALLKDLERHPALLAAVFKEINTYLSDAVPGRTPPSDPPTQQADPTSAQPQPPVRESVQPSAAGTATLIIRRPSAISGSLRRFPIFLDHNKIGDIGNGQEVTFQITPGTHSAHVTMDWLKSDVLTFTAQAGETVILHARWQMSLTGGKMILEP